MEKSWTRGGRHRRRFIFSLPITQSTVRKDERGLCGGDECFCESQGPELTEMDEVFAFVTATGNKIDYQQAGR